MKERKDCKIVQDLLPNYIEKLTNEETNKFIEEHLKECKECKKVLENMKKDIKVSTNKVNKEEVNYIKKYSKRMRILKLILLSIIFIYIVIVTRRTFIMMLISEKASENQNIDNYYAKLYSYQGDTLIITESYNKGEDYLTTMSWNSNNNQNRKLIFYKKGNEKIALSEYEDKKYILGTETTLGAHIRPVTYVSEGFFANLQYALFIGVDTTYCNGKECYVIKGSSYERYIDKETGLAIRSIEKSTKDITRENDMIVDYEYKFNSVKDSDIVKPDIISF